MKKMTNDPYSVNKDDTEVALRIFIRYVTGGLVEIFFDSQKRSIIQSEAREVKEIILKRTPR